MEKNSLKNEVIRAQDILKQIQMRFSAEYQLNANVLEEIKNYKQKLQCMENERSQSLLEIERHLSIIAKTNEELQQRLNNETSWLCDADEDISQISSDKKENKQPNKIQDKNLDNVSTTYALKMNENVPNCPSDIPPSSNLEKYLQDLYQELCTRVQDQQEKANKTINEPSVELAAIKDLLDEGDKRLQKLSAKNNGNWTKDDGATNPTIIQDKVSPSQPLKPKLEESPKARSQVSFQVPIQEGWVNSKTSTPTMQSPINVSFPVAKETTDNSCEVSLTNSSPPEESSKTESPTPRPVGPIQPPSFPANQMSPTACFEDRFLGKGKDYFEEMFYNTKDLFSLDQDYKTGKNHISKATPPLFQEYNATTSSAIGNLCILEINEEGKFVRLYNADRKDAEIGNYMIKQNVSGHPVIVFRFPPRTKFPRNSIITIWAASCDNDVFHNPPSNYIWDAQIKWGVGREFTTILCKPNGQAIAWTNAAHKFNPQLSPQIPMTPIHVRTMQRMTPGSPIEMKPSCRNEIALNVRNSTQAWDKNLVFLKREKSSPTPVMCVKHPYGLSPGNLVHPCVGKEGGEKWSSRVSTPIDTPEPKKYLPRKTFIPKRYSNINGRRSISQSRKDTESKNSLNKSHSPKTEVDLLSCAAFMKPSTQLRFGLGLIRAQHNMTYNPPMPKLSRSAW